MTTWLWLEKGFWLGCAALGFALLFNVPRRTLLGIFVIAAVSGLVRIALVQYGLIIGLATFAAASLAGVLSVRLAHQFKAPPMVFAIPAVIPMVPGFFSYQAMVGLIKMTTEKDPLTYSQIFFATVHDGLTAFVVMLALSIGVAIPMLILRKQSIKRLQSEDDLEQAIE